MNNKLELNTDEPRENENPLGPLRVLVFCLSLAVMTVITAWPHAFGSTSATMQHNAALLSTMGMSCGFVYGIGFTPKAIWLQLLFSAPVALSLLLSGFIWVML
jgi:predicted membrane protein